MASDTIVQQAIPGAVDVPDSDLSFETSSRESKFGTFYAHLGELREVGQKVIFPVRDDCPFDLLNERITRALTFASKRVPPPNGCRYVRKIVAGRNAIAVVLEQDNRKPRKPRVKAESLI